MDFNVIGLPAGGAAMRLRGHVHLSLQKAGLVDAKNSLLLRLSGPSGFAPLEWKATSNLGWYQTFNEVVTFTKNGEYQLRAQISVEAASKAKGARARVDASVSARLTTAAATPRAYQFPVGFGYGPTRPDLTMNGRPNLGGSDTVTLNGAASQAPGILFLSLPHAKPAAAAHGCLFYLDLAPGHFVPAANLWTNPAGAWSVTFAAPSSASMVGTRFAMQAGIVEPSTPTGFSLTNAIHGTLGH